MRRILKDLENVSLSNEEMLKLVDGKSNLIQYPQLKDATNIDDVLYPYGACIILYLTKQNYGHWTCIFKVNDDTIEHFDPYGLYIDEELSFKMDPYFRKIVNEDYPHLSYLLYHSPYKLSFNQYQFQKKLKEVATCGRHTSTRLLLRHLPLNEYKDLICSGEPDYSPDEVVTIVTYSILKI